MLAFDLEPTSATRRFEPVIARCAYVWAAYAVVEFLAVSLSPLLFLPDSMLAIWHWRISGILVLLYAALAVVTALPIGLALARSSIGYREDRLRAAAALAIAALFTISPPSTGAIRLGSYVSLAASAALSIVLAAILARPSLAQRAPWLTNPWFVSIAAVGPQWLNLGPLRDVPTPMRLAAGALLVALAALAAAKSPPLRFPARFALTGGITIVSAGLAFWLGSRPVPLQDITPAGQAQRSPDVILIVMDTVRADHLSVYGYPRKTTPFLERFAESAILYRRCISASDFSLPSHASMFTGLYPSWHGAHSDESGMRPLADGFITIAEDLSARGYRTMGVSANHAFLGPQFGLDQGFQIMDARQVLPVSPFFPAVRNLLRSLLNRAASTIEFHLVYRRADEINAAAFRMLDWAERAGRRAPFFLFLNYMDAHAPHGPPPPFDRMFPGRIPHWTHQDSDRIIDEVLRTGRSATQDELHHQSALYDGAIAHTDARIGELIGELKRRGRYDDSLIVVTSDHGEAFGERGLVEHGGVSVYQEEVHVPLIVKFPGAQRQQVVEAAVSLVDVAPTVLEAAGAPIPPRMHGVSLRQTARGNARGAVFSESHATPMLSPLAARFRRLERSVVDGSAKFITSTTGKRELYNLDLDPGEKTNLYRPDQAATRELAAKIDRILKGAPKFDRKGLPPDALERLRSLGYVQ